MDNACQCCGDDALLGQEVCANCLIQINPELFIEPDIELELVADEEVAEFIELVAAA